MSQDYLRAILDHARTKVADPKTPPHQRDLWAQIIDELTTWLAEPEPDGLFDA